MFSRLAPFASLVALVVASPVPGSVAPELITRVADVRSLSSEEANRPRPVRLRGIVTWRSGPEEFAIQDPSGGTWVHLAGARRNGYWTGDDASLEQAVEGMEVEIEGVTHAAGYAPVVWPSRLRCLGLQALPPARPLDRTRFFGGVESGERIEAEGIVLGFESGAEGWRLRLQSGPDLIQVIVTGEVLDDPEGILDARVTVRGVGGSVFNTRREFLHPRIQVSVPGDLVAEAPMPEAAAPRVVPLDQLRAFRHAPERPQRVRVEGTVTHVVAERSFLLQEGSRVIRVESPSSLAIRQGDRIEAVGFVDMKRHIGGLGGADVRKLGTGDLPEAIAITPEEIMAANIAAIATGQAPQPHDFDGHLIRFQARLLAIQYAPETASGSRRLVLEQGGMTLEAVLHSGEVAALDLLRAGSLLELTGFVQLEFAEKERAGRSDLHPVRLSCMLRDASDVVVVRAPSWWTVRRLLGLTAVVLFLLCLALVWAWQLRRQIERKTHQLAEEMRARRDAAVEFQATLRERNRLAANLHDTLLQSMSGIGFQLEACEAAVARPREGHTPADHLEVARQMVDRSALELRNSVWMLRSLPLGGLTLPDALHSMAERASAGQTARIEVRLEGDFAQVPDFIAGNLLLAAQEAVHNALKHGKPDHVRIEAGPAKRPGWLALTITDDGCGFLPGSEPVAADGHFGLSGIRERVKGLDGTVHIESAPSRGTIIRLEVPVRPYDAELA